MVFLEILQNSQQNTCARVSFLIKLQAEAYNFIKKETPAQLFSCEFCRISGNTFSDTSGGCFCPFDLLSGEVDVQSCF